jgi:hypothetical protein
MKIMQRREKSYTPIPETRPARPPAPAPNVCRHWPQAPVRYPYPCISGVIVDPKCLTWTARLDDSRRILRKDVKYVKYDAM